MSLASSSSLLKQMAVLNRQRVFTKNCSPPFSAKNCSPSFSAKNEHKDRAAVAASDVHQSNKGSSSRASKRKRHDEQQQEEAERRRIEQQQQQRLLEQYLKSRPPKKRIFKPSDDKMRLLLATHRSPLAVALDLNKAPPDWCGKRFEHTTDKEEDHGISLRSSPISSSISRGLPASKSKPGTELAANSRVKETRSLLLIQNLRIKLVEKKQKC